MWDFLVGLKQATESGFQRMESLKQATESGMESLRQMTESGFQRMDFQLAAMRSDMERFERRLVRIDDRLSGLEDLTIKQRLDDHEARISGLENRSV